MPEILPEVSGRRPLSLDQLIALNDEIAAMVRGGLPLGRGLIELGGDLHGRLGSVSAVLGDRMARGSSLPEAIAAEGDRFPRLYLAVVEAGLRSGHLSAALEGLASFARRFAETRRAIGLAMTYPLIVLLVAYAMFVVFVFHVAPRFLATFESFQLPVAAPLAWLTKIGGTVGYWGPVVPIVILAVGVAWSRTGRASGLRPGGGGSWSILRFIPWFRPMMVNSEAADFADLLALMIDHQVPLPEALTLAADAAADPSFQRAGRELARAVVRGESPGEALSESETGPFPPLLRWLMATAPGQGDLGTSLHYAAQVYRDRALHQAELIRVFFPTILLLAVGATATLLYAATLFLPLTALLESLSAP